MGRLTSQEVFWKEKLANPTSTDAEKVKAAEELEKIKRRYARTKARARCKKSSSQENDPRPAWFPLDGGSYPEYLDKLAAWEKRHPEGYVEPVRPTPAPAPKKIELPKPAPVVVAPIVKPAPKPVPIPPPVIRTAREGHSGFFYTENFWNLSPDERRGKMCVANANAALKAEWDSICEAMTTRVTPREAPVPQKAAPIERPAVRELRDVFAVGQVQPVSEARKLSEPTMQNASGPVTRELDKRGWLPDCKPEELTPSR